MTEARVAAVAPTVLLVEDEDGVRELIRDLLGRRGYRVLEARRPAEALASFADHATAIGLLITDMVMPGMTGRELAESLRARKPGLRVLFMSGYIDDHVLTLGAPSGARFLQKPFTPRALLAVVRELLEDASD